MARFATPPGKTSGHNRQPSVSAAGSLSRSVPPAPGHPSAPGHVPRGKLPGHRGPNPRPICSRQRRVGRKASCHLGSPDAFRHLEPERADDTIEDLERHTELAHLPEVTSGEIRSFQRLLAQLGQRMQTAAEQRSHLLCSHRVADGQAVDPVQAGADPDAWRLTAFGVLGRQPGMTFLGRIQGSHLAGQVVIPGSRSELVDAHRHTHPKGVHAACAVRATRATSDGAWDVSHIGS